MGFRNKPKHQAKSGLRRQHTGVAGFTLIELLAVVVIILILTGLVIRVAGYAQYRMAVSTTKAQLATIQAALEMYKADWGYYPITNPVRLSAPGDQQASNNFILYYTLSAANSYSYSNFAGYPVTYTSVARTGRKTYLRFSATQIRTNFSTQYYNSGANVTSQLETAVLNIYDAFGRPIVYYNSPKTVLANSGGIMSGQVNPAIYDLFSFGPDGYTYSGVGWTGVWTNPAAVTDDITGGGR